ncbi:MAG: phosphoribosylanthranilate isomerase [Bacillota bacterium]
MISIKVCGMTNKKNIKNIIKTGVNALGFILADSSRQVTLNKAEKLIKNIPPFISRVAVTVNPDQYQINQIINSKLFDYIQFHGEESPDLIKKSPLKNIKAISISEKNDLKLIDKYNLDCIDYFLFDNKTQTKRGGTGVSFNWNLIRDISISKPFILAGGLGPDNVKRAVKLVNPAAVDLNSSIEKSPGIKDIKLYKNTLSEIKNL